MLEILTEQEFNEFSSSNGGMFFQSSYWGDLKSFTGWNSHIVGLKKEGKIKAATLLLAKKIPILSYYIYYSPRGFVVDYDDLELVKEFAIKVKNYVKKNKGIFLKINPYLSYQKRDVDGNIIDNETKQNIIDMFDSIDYKHNGFTTSYGRDLEPRFISVLDLKGKTEEELLSNMRPTTRWSINNSYKHGLKLVEIGKSRLIEFKKLMEHTGERRDFIDRPLSYYEKMYEAFSKDDKIKIMLVELDIEEYLVNLKNQKQENMLKQAEIKGRQINSKGERVLKELQFQLESLNNKIDFLKEIEEKKGKKIVIAGGLFMTFGKEVVSLFGASYKEYMKFNAQYYLNFKMIKYALNNNYEKYNFYGITGDFFENSPMYGLFDFKRGFNSQVVELVGEFSVITNRPFNKLYEWMFRIYKKLKKRGH